MEQFCRWGVLHWRLEVVSMQVHGHPRGPADVCAHLRRPHGPGPGQLPLWVEIPRQRSTEPLLERPAVQREPRPARAGIAG